MHDYYMTGGIAFHIRPLGKSLVLTNVPIIIVMYAVAILKCRRDSLGVSYSLVWGIDLREYSSPVRQGRI